MLPFQFSRKDKTQAVKQLIMALEHSNTLTTHKDREALINGNLSQTLEHVLEEKTFQKKLNLLLEVEKPIRSVTELIDFLNQRNHKQTLLKLLNEYKSQCQQESTYRISFFSQKTDPLQVAESLIKKLNGDDGAEVSEIDCLMQGNLGSQIKDFIASYERVNTIKIKDLKQLISLCSETQPPKDEIAIYS